LRLDLNIGDRLLRPSDNEQLLGLVGAAGLVLGLVLDSRIMKIGGALVLSGVAYSVYEEAALFAQPETMNSYFQTGGQTSALGPSPLIERAVAYEADRLELVAPYETGAAAAPVLAGVHQGRARRRR